jgi:hypothetical protein
MDFMILRINSVCSVNRINFANLCNGDVVFGFEVSTSVTEKSSIFWDVTTRN